MKQHFFIKRFQCILLLLLLSTGKLCAQDVIVKKDGSTILCKTIEITSDIVKYKKVSNLDGPTYSIKKSELLSINYENGEKDEFAAVKNEKEVISNDNQENPLVLKAGTEIPIQIVSPIKAADVKVGQSIPFKVSRDISVDGITVIPYGTPVKGIVYKANKSSWWGTKGKLGIQINNITLPNGGQIPLQNGNVYVTGTNRTALSVLLFLFVTIPACAICGSKAAIPVGYEVLASVAENVTINTDGTIKTTPTVQQSVIGTKPTITLNEGKLATIIDYYGNTMDCMIISVNGDDVIYRRINNNGKPEKVEHKISKYAIQEIKYK